MKTLLITSIIVFVVSCGKISDSHESLKNDTITNATQNTNSSIDSSKFIEDNDSIPFSTYDLPQHADVLTRHQESLKLLFKNKVFHALHISNRDSLNENHQKYFAQNTKYKILLFQKGNIFDQGKEDAVFLTYDSLYNRISIIVYDDKNHNYSELYRGIKVENGLLYSKCNYTAFGTLDYQLADEMVYQEKYLLKDPLSYLRNSPTIKIIKPYSNNDFVPESGCFSHIMPRNDSIPTMFISTSSVYNNWEGLRYDHFKNRFVIFYGQAFAD